MKHAARKKKYPDRIINNINVYCGSVVQTIITFEEFGFPTKKLLLVVSLHSNTHLHTSRPTAKLNK